MQASEDSSCELRAPIFDLPTGVWPGGNPFRAVARADTPQRVQLKWVHRIQVCRSINVRECALNTQSD